MWSTRIRVTLVLNVVAASAAVMVWRGTTRGIGIFGDSVVYLSTAREFSTRGRLYVAGIADPRPLTEFPPLYPMLLSIGGDGLRTARLLNVAGTFASVLLCGLITRWAMRSGLLSVWVAALAATSVLLLGVALRAYSEAVFTALSLAALWCFARRATASSDAAGGRWLASCGALLSGCAVMRYAGLFYIAAFCLWVGRQAWRRRERPAPAVVACAASIVLPLAWMMRNRIVVGQATSRRFDWHPPTADTLQHGVLTFANVVGIYSPFSVAICSGGLILAAICARAVVLLFGRKAAGVDREIEALACLQVTCMSAGLLASLTFFDSGIPLNYRILSPTFPLLFVVVGIWLQRAIARLPRRRPLRAAAWALPVAFVVVRAASVESMVRDASAKGVGYSEVRYSESATLAFLASHHFAGRMIYTNAPDLIYVRTGLECRPVPMSRLRITGQSNTRRYPEMRKMARDLHETNGLVVFFDRIKRDDYLLSERELVEKLKLRVVAKLDDGRVYSLE